jgi:hypothetical protein
LAVGGWWHITQLEQNDNATVFNQHTAQIIQRGVSHKISQLIFVEDIQALNARIRSITAGAENAARRRACIADRNEALELIAVERQNQRAYNTTSSLPDVPLADRARLVARSQQECK